MTEPCFCQCQVVEVSVKYRYGGYNPIISKFFPKHNFIYCANGVGVTRAVLDIALEEADLPYTKMHWDNLTKWDKICQRKLDLDPKDIIIAY